MKKLKYQIQAYRSIWDAETETDVTVEDAVGIEGAYSDAALAHALKVAIDGQYEIIDDGEPEPEPTQLDRIEAQTTYTALMTDTLLEG